MGPRQKSLGNCPSCDNEVWIDTIASMGPRQKSLGNFAINTLCIVVYMLQWGRGKKASEIAAFDLSPKQEYTASMGPRQKSLGNYYTTKCKYRPRLASMGPRQKSLGNNRTSASTMTDTL